MKAQDKIIRAAEEIFSEYQYEHATVKMICSKAGVNIASVNYHFRSKKDLYLEVLASIRSKINYSAVREFELQAEESRQAGWERFVAELISNFTSPPKNVYFKKWHKIVFRELNNPSEVFDDIYGLYFRPILDQIDSNIKYFFPDMPSQERLRWTTSIISQAGFIYSSQSLIVKYGGEDFYSRENMEKYSKQVVDLICNSLKIKE